MDEERFQIKKIQEESKKARIKLEEIFEKFHLVPEDHSNENLFYIIPRAKWIISEEAKKGCAVLLVGYSNQHQGYEKDIGNCDSMLNYCSMQLGQMDNYCRKNNIKFGRKDDYSLFDFEINPRNLFGIEPYGPRIKEKPGSVIGTAQVEEQLRKFYSKAFYFCLHPDGDELTLWTGKRLEQIFDEENTFFVLPPHYAPNHMKTRFGDRILSEPKYDWYEMARER